MKRRKYFVMMIVCVLSLFLPIFGNAAETKAVCGLTLSCEVSGTEFMLYQVTDGFQNGNYRLLAPFDDYQLEVKGLDQLNGLDSEGWRTLAATLEEYVTADGIKPLSKQTLSAQKTVVWENLSKGLYLIIGTQTKDKDYIYTMTPMLITLPNKTEVGTYDYHPEIKYTKFEKEPMQKIKNLEVIKIWKDSENSKSRPSEVTIELLRDGKEYEIIKLNAKNNWKHQWKELSSDYRWTVVEKNISSSYQVEYSKSGEKIYVINHYKEPEKSDTPNNQITPDPPKSDKLPQTGQLWWPVPILAVLGIIAWMVGGTKRRIE